MRKFQLFSTLLLLCASAANSQLSTPTNALLIPVVGRVYGANGTLFSTDGTLTNLRDIDQTVQVLWLPQSPSTPVQPVSITIPAHSTMSSENFALEVMPCLGLCQQPPSAAIGMGAVLITASTPAGAIDPAGQLIATARIWTLEPGTTGTVSQTFPVIAAGSLKPMDHAVIFGQRIDSRFRTNVGIVNLDPVYARAFQITQTVDSDLSVSVPATTTLTVAPMAMTQVALYPTPSTREPLRIDVAPLPIPEGSVTNQWVAYGSSIDNVTGDSWSTLAVAVSHGQ